MLRKRDPLAPSGLTDQQKRAICRDPRVLELGREQRELKGEMRWLAGTVAKARELFPHLPERHEAVKKELSRVRKNLTKDTRKTARKEYFHNVLVLEVDRQIKQILGQSDAESCDDGNSDDEDWDIPIPKYVFPERGRLVENLYGPEAECFDADKLLARPYPGHQRHGCALEALRTKPARQSNQLGCE
jgi:hypothetical protein